MAAGWAGRVLASVGGWGAEFGEDCLGRRAILSLARLPGLAGGRAARRARQHLFLAKETSKTGPDWTRQGRGLHSTGHGTKQRIGQARTGHVDRTGQDRT